MEGLLREIGKAVGRDRLERKLGDFVLKYINSEMLRNVVEAVQ